MAMIALRHMPTLVLFAILLLLPPELEAQQDSTVAVKNDSVTIQLVDADLRAAIQALSRHLDRPVIFGAISGTRVTLETPRPVPRSEVLLLLRGLLESQNFELVADSGLYRVRPRDQRSVQPALDPRVARSAGGMELFVVRLSHAKAADVAATVNALYGRASALGELGTRPPTLSDELRQHQVPPAGAGFQESPVGASRPATLTGETVIVPDPRSNSLLVRANRSDFELIQAAVRELDVRPLQVLIEVLIAEARRDRSRSFGVDISLPETTPYPSSNTTVSGSNKGLGLGDFALRLMNLGSLDFEATLRAAAARGDVTIISRPIILTANNESAQILVGSQRPFVQVARSLPTDAPVRDQVIQYKDVGTRLTVLPTISGDGYVMLEVTQEVNAATTETAFDAPVISTRSVQTHLLIKDGQTVVLGGLSDRQRDATKAGVPVLSSIPIIGALFGRTSRRSTDTELFLFLTPRVIRSDDEAQSATEPFKDRADRVKQ